VAFVATTHSATGGRAGRVRRRQRRFDARRHARSTTISFSNVMKPSCRLAPDTLRPRRSGTWRVLSWSRRRDPTVRPGSRGRLERLAGSICHLTFMAEGCRAWARADDGSAVDSTSNRE
jgi:hypothetical protein